MKIEDAPGLFPRNLQTVDVTWSVTTYQLTATVWRFLIRCCPGGMHWRTWSWKLVLTKLAPSLYTGLKFINISVWIEDWRFLGNSFWFTEPAATRVYNLAKVYKLDWLDGRLKIEETWETLDRNLQSLWLQVLHSSIYMMCCFWRTAILYYAISPYAILHRSKRYCIIWCFIILYSSTLYSIW